jgi:hypothetical protein
MNPWRIIMKPWRADAARNHAPGPRFISHELKKNTRANRGRWELDLLLLE